MDFCIISIVRAPDTHSTLREAQSEMKPILRKMKFFFHRLPKCQFPSIEIHLKSSWIFGQIKKKQTNKQTKQKTRGSITIKIELIHEPSNLFWSMMIGFWFLNKVRVCLHWIELVSYIYRYFHTIHLFVDWLLWLRVGSSYFWFCYFNCYYSGCLLKKKKPYKHTKTSRDRINELRDFSNLVFVAIAIL